MTTDARTSILFDDVIFALQRSGGASVYWREVTSRVEADPRFLVARSRPARLKRGVPTFSTADVFHSSHFRICPLGGARNVQTVYDLNYELGLVRAGLGARLNLLERRLAFFTADALVCISENTRRDLFEVYPALRGRCPALVIHLGVSPQGAPPPPADGAAENAPPFLLYVGGRAAYKRFDVALDAFHASGIWRDGVRLLCTGAAFDEAERSRIASLGLSGSVAVVEHCSAAELARLYRSAHGLLYTSTYEGFGLPVLEAMSHGCPVVAARISSIPEVAGDAAILCTPGAPGEVADAIHRLQDPVTRAALVEKGRARVGEFTWERSAAAHMKLYLALARGETPAV